MALSSRPGPERTVLTYSIRVAMGVPSSTVRPTETSRACEPYAAMRRISRHAGHPAIRRCYTRCPVRARGAWQNEPVAAGLEGGGPSVTARHVAAHRLGFTRVPAPYGDPAADDALAADVAAGREAPLNRMHDYLAARTAFFDRIVVAAIGRGVRQIVVGAAGYDGRALRYAKPGVRWFEVDHPATQRDKLTRLERLGRTRPPAG